MEEEDTQVYVTYPGWSKQYNEWLPKNKIVDFNPVGLPANCPTKGSLQERQQLIVHCLLADIKRALKCVRKESPRITIRRDIQSDECDAIFGVGKIGKERRFQKNSALSSQFGDLWMQRIDEVGNCSYIIPGTLCVSLRNHRRIQEYDVEGKQWSIYPGTYILLSFVRGDATKEQLQTRQHLWQN